MLRAERIEKMLKELRYEIEVGILQGELSEQMHFEWIIPISKIVPDGVVLCVFCTRPVPFYAVSPELREPRLRIVR